MMNQTYNFLLAISRLDFVLIICIAIIVAILVFLFSGFYGNDSKHIIIIEKRKKFYTHMDDGVYYFLPFIYKKVGKYWKGKRNEIYKYKQSSFFISYEIYDFVKFHYGVGPIKKYLADKQEADIETIKKSFFENGAYLYEIKQAINN